MMDHNTTRTLFQAVPMICLLLPLVDGVGKDWAAAHTMSAAPSMDGALELHLLVMHQHRGVEMDASHHMADAVFKGHKIARMWW